MDFDVVVIGAGPGGVATAKAAALEGLRVALVNKGHLLGYGLEGAFKSKALYEIAREHHNFCVRWPHMVNHDTFDFSEICRSNETGTSVLRGHHTKHLRSLGIELIEGWGRFVDAHTINVDGRLLETENVVVATGTRPRIVDGIEVDGEFVLTSDEIVSIDRRVGSMCVLGAGVIGSEFASIYAALGVDVVLMDSRERILHHEDEDISRMLETSFEQLGITVVPGARCTSMKRVGDKVVTELADGRKYETDLGLVSIGRIPNTDGMDMDKAGVVLDRWGYISTNSTMMSNVDNIYAVGDVGMRNTLDMCLVHVAEAEARNAVSHMKAQPNLLEDAKQVPFIIFTLPMVAGAGLNEREARKIHGNDIRVGKYANIRNHRARTRGRSDGFVKLICAAEGDDRILGARAVGDGVDGIIGEVSVMIQHELPYTYLLDSIHPHPSLSESLQGAARIICRDAVPYSPGEEFEAHPLQSQVIRAVLREAKH